MKHYVAQASFVKHWALILRGVSRHMFYKLCGDERASQGWGRLGSSMERRTDQWRQNPVSLRIRSQVRQSRLVIGCHMHLIMCRPQSPASGASLPPVPDPRGWLIPPTSIFTKYRCVPLSFPGVNSAQRSQIALSSPYTGRNPSKMIDTSRPVNVGGIFRFLLCYVFRIRNAIPHNLHLTNLR